ncbi:unnamed protein product [Acanthocheilonema viteae]|uniref:Uncharacterized protein n=1 Tax=Acanthocheilonema viteae TaxID=6277 RepID=A0A498SLU3_ACAVI|nr:unnamed protein product [Acanthocheilonema viteae]
MKKRVKDKKLEQFTTKQEKEEQEEREIRRRARREASLDKISTDEFAPTIFEQVNAPLKPVINFECFRKEKVSEQTPSLTQLSARGSSLSTPTPSVYLSPDVDRMSSAEPEKLEYAASNDVHSIPDPIVLESQISNQFSVYNVQIVINKIVALLSVFQKKSGKSNEVGTYPDITDKALETSVKKDETLQTTHGSSEGSRERTEEEKEKEKEKAMGQSVYFIPDLKMEQNLTATSDMSYFDISRRSATSKKGSAELESSKRSAKTVKSETSATENATKQVLSSKKSLPSSSPTMEPNIAISRFHRKIITTLKHGVGAFGSGVASATHLSRKVKESDVSNKNMTVVKGSESETTSSRDTSKRKKDKNKANPLI